MPLCSSVGNGRLENIWERNKVKMKDWDWDWDGRRNGISCVFEAIKYLILFFGLDQRLKLFDGKK